MSGLLVGGIYRLRFPGMGWVRVLPTPPDVTVTMDDGTPGYLVETLITKNRWWAREDGKPNNHASPWIAVPLSPRESNHDTRSDAPTLKHPGEIAVKIWFDTEFIEDGKTIDLLSIGMVREDGAELYLENLSADVNKASPWVQENVICYLDYIKHGVAREEIGPKVRAFVGESPEFWAYYADYDWVALCQLYGTMMDLPKGWPMYCRDVKQLCDEVGNPKLPQQDGAEHHALADAKWTRVAWEFLRDRRNGMATSALSHSPQGSEEANG